MLNLALAMVLVDGVSSESLNLVLVIVLTDGGMAADSIRAQVWLACVVDFRMLFGVCVMVGDFGVKGELFVVVLTDKIHWYRLEKKLKFL